MQNIKKNVTRFIQSAGQGLGRAEKTEVLTESIQNAEKRVENLKSVLEKMVKKITASLHSHGITESDKPDRRMKKIPAYAFSTSFAENSELYGEGLLKDIFTCCATGFESISKEQSTYEQIVEKETLAYFQNLLDVEIPALKKTKQTLTKLTLDMDALKTKQQSVNQGGQVNQSKIDLLQAELDDAENKVLACKDQYATEILTFISKENEISSKIIEWIKSQCDFHQKCVKFMEDMMTDMKGAVSRNSTRPLYGCPLSEHLESSGRTIAYVIEVCVSILYHKGIKEEGLFRLAGGASKLKKLKAALNLGAVIDVDEFSSDIHVVAGALKMYLRELPEPLLTFDLFEKFRKYITIRDKDEKLKQILNVINELPRENYDNVKYLIKFLAELANNSDVNKMTSANIGIVFGPNLLWSQNGDEGGVNIGLSAVQNHLVETLVLHHNYFFPGDVAFADLDACTSTSSPGVVNNCRTVTEARGVQSEIAVVIRPEDSPSETERLSNTSSISSLGTPASEGAFPSPVTNRKNKKPAPAPPPSLPPLKDPSHKLEASPSDPPSIHRSESIKKPMNPPPEPPTPTKNHRPINPPPPCPAPPVPKADTSSECENSATDSVTAYATADVVKHDSQESIQLIKNSSSEIPSPIIESPNQSPVTARGHMRAKSHGSVIKNPPPIPQRTNSINTKPASVPIKVKPPRPPSIDEKLPKNNTGSEQNIAEQKERANSVSDSTSF